MSGIVDKIDVLLSTIFDKSSLYLSNIIGNVKCMEENQDVLLEMDKELIKGLIVEYQLFTREMPFVERAVTLLWIMEY